MLCTILLAFFLTYNKPVLSQKRIIPMEVICDPDSKRCLPLSSNLQETGRKLEENSEAREVNTWYPIPRWKVLFAAAKNSGRGFVANFNKPNPGGADGYAHANDFTLFQALDGSTGPSIRLRRLTGTSGTATLAPEAEMKVSPKKDEEGDGNLFLFATHLDGNVISDAGSLKNNPVMEKSKQNVTHSDGGGIDGDNTSLKISDLEVDSEDASLNLTKADETITSPSQIKDFLSYLKSNAKISFLESDDYRNTTDQYLEVNVFNGSDGVRNAENDTKLEPFYLHENDISVVPSIAGTTRLGTLNETQFYNATRNSDLKLKQLLDNLIFYSTNSSNDNKSYSSSKKPINLHLNFNFRFRRAICTSSECKIRNKILDSLGYSKHSIDYNTINNKRKHYRVSNKSRETLLLKIYKSADLEQASASLLYEHPNRLPQRKQSLEQDKPDQYVIDSVEMAKMYRNERTYSRQQEFIAHGISDNVPVVNGSWKSHQIDALVPDTATVPPLQLNEVPRRNDSVSRYATPRFLKSELQIFEEDSFDKDSGALRMESEVDDQLKNDIKEEVSGEQYIYTTTRNSPILLSEHNIALNFKRAPSIEKKSEIKQSVRYINALENASNENMSLKTNERQNFNYEQNEHSKYIQDKASSIPTEHSRTSSNEILIMPIKQPKKLEELNYESKSKDLNYKMTYFNLRHTPQESLTTPTNDNSTLRLPDHYLLNSTRLDRKRREIETTSAEFKNLNEREVLQPKAINPEFLKAIEFLINQSPPHVNPLTQENDSSRDTEDGSPDTNTHSIYSKQNNLHPVNSEWRSYSKSEITHSEPNSDLTEVRRNAQPYFPRVHGEHSPIFKNAPYTYGDTKYNAESSSEWRILGRAADTNIRTIFASYTPKSKENPNVDSPQTFTRPKHVISTLRNLMKSNGHKEKWPQSVSKNKSDDTQKPEVMWYIILPIEKDASWPRYILNLPTETSNSWPRYIPILPTEKGNSWPRYIPNLPTEKSNNWPHYMPVEKSNSWNRYITNLPTEKSNRWLHHVPNLPIEKNNRWPQYVPTLPARWPHYLPTFPTRKASNWPHYVPASPTRKGTRWPHYVPSLPPEGNVRPSERELESERPEDDIEDHITSGIPISTKPLNTNVSNIMPRLVEFINKTNTSRQGSLREMKSLSMNISVDNMMQELPDDQWIYITTTEANNKTNVTMNPYDIMTTVNSTLNVTTQKTFRKLTTERGNQETTTKTTLQIATKNTNQNVTYKPNTFVAPTRHIRVLTTKSKSFSTTKQIDAVTSNKPNISLATTESIISLTTGKSNNNVSTKIPENIISKPWSMKIPWDCCDQWFVPSKWRNKNTTPMMMGMMGGD